VLKLWPAQHDIAAWKTVSAVPKLFPVEHQRAAQAPVLCVANSSTTEFAEIKFFNVLEIKADEVF